MANELEKFRKEKFDQWWSVEILPRMKELPRELRDKLETHKNGFLKHYISHDPIDDFLLGRVSVVELKKEFEDWFDNNGKLFLKSILESYIRIGKFI